MSDPGQENSSRSERRVFGLDTLRAAAILGVVLSHFFVGLYPHFGDALGFFGHLGFYGVELFFVLSGFLIGQILLRTGPSIGHPRNLSLFYLRRWFRTLPLFILFFGVNLVIEYRLHHHPLSGEEMAQHGLFVRTLTANRITFFGESWSLAIEEWFYLLFPAALAAGIFMVRQFDRVFLVTAATFYLFSTISRIVMAPAEHSTWDQWQRMIVINRFDALMIGMIAAWVASRWPDRWRAYARPLAIASGTILVILYFSLWRVHNGRLAFAPDSFFARTFRFNLISLCFAMLLPAASGWTLLRETPISLAVRNIALWSYAMYLAHLPVYAFTEHYLFKGWRTSLSQALALFSLQMVLTIVLSALLYRFFETRCTRLREPVGRWLMRRGALEQ